MNGPATPVFAPGTLCFVETVADRLRWVLEHRGLTARGLSLAAGMSSNAVQKIFERGGSANAATLAALASAAKVSFAWLATGRGTPDDRDDVAQAPAPEDVDVAGQRPVATDAARTHRPLLENLPDWPELLAGAKQIAADRGREIPDWAWATLAKSGGLLTGPLTSAAVFDLGKTYADHGIGKPRPAPEREVSGVVKRAKEGQ